jgi:hypothetical protein
MALFFDAAWVDARLAELQLDRTVLANAAGLSREDLALIIGNEREATGAEIRAFAALLQVDLVEMSLKCGVAARTPPSGDADPAERLDQLNARLDAIDDWLAEFERETRKTGSGK